jgi:hypothetical protein
MSTTSCAVARGRITANHKAIRGSSALSNCEAPAVFGSSPLCGDNWWNSGVVTASGESSCCVQELTKQTDVVAKAGGGGCMRTVLPKICVSITLIANMLWLVLLGYALTKLF